MAKDPAFLFYSSDFLSGVCDLTMEERGQYITLLCLQHQKGHLNEKTICLSLGSCSVDVLAKFKKDESGNYYNQKLEDEIIKRTQYTDSRAINGKKGGRPPKNNNHMDNPSLSTEEPKKNHTEDENKDENKDENLNKKSSNLRKLEIEVFDIPDPFIAIWDRWVKYKKDQHKFKYKSKDSEETAKNELLKLCGGDPEKATQILDYSIARGYQGFFELKSIQGQELSKEDKNKQSTLNAINILQKKFQEKQAV